MNKLIIIGLNHPEPDTTAAGNRMMQLIDLFSSHDYQITFLCAQPPSERSFDLTSIGIKTKLIQLNHSSFDKLIKELNPDVVLFDRFITEEQYGWRVAEQCPNSLRILDTEDLHFLRKAREEAVIKGNDLDRMDLYSESAIREIASIYRCDLSLIISEIEMELLTNDFNIISELLYYFPFVFEKRDSNFQNGLKSFEQREGFIFIGNFKHAPNMDSILYLKERIWPLIKKEIPDATLSVYGAYASESINLLYDEGEGFLIKGWTENVDVVMEQARICLAPLRFGAGLKGKILMP